MISGREAVQRRRKSKIDWWLRSLERHGRFKKGKSSSNGKSISGEGGCCLKLSADL
jgi:hypothetical protein